MASDRVPLRDGPTLPLDVIEQILDFGDRGFRLTAYPDGSAGIGPSDALTRADRGWIDVHVLDLRAAIHYLDAVCAWPLASIGTRLAPSVHPPARLAVEPRAPRVSSPAAVPQAPVAEPRQLALHAEAD
jgi:hypothetical protein